MTKRNFKSGINSELKQKGFSNKVKEITEAPFSFQTILVMEKEPTEKEKEFFLERFKKTPLETKIINNLVYV